MQYILDMAQTFFTSDWHLGDDKLYKLGRPYENTDEMALGIAEAYDRVVGDEDTVYIIGDVVRDPTWPWEEFLAARKGTKILLRGNHDRQLADADFAPYFEQIVAEGDGLELRITHEDVTLPIWLTHYPTRSRPDLFNLVGHIHSQWKVQKNMLNIGVDTNFMRPYTVDRVMMLYNAICNVYDDDVWVADLAANQAHDARGPRGSYFPPTR